MGEYAKRYSDGQEVKIGTCHNMYYLRWEDRNKVDYQYDISCHNWRLPLPDEDGFLPGSYSTFESWKTDWHARLWNGMEKGIVDDPEFVNNPGSVQLRVDSLGMLVNVKCYHGTQLPESNDDVRYAWNGKEFPLRLCCTRNEPDEMYIIVACKACGQRWMYSFKEIERFIISQEMRLRLLKICQDYWEDVNDDWHSGYFVQDVIKDGKNTEIQLAPFPADEYGEKDEHIWSVKRNGENIFEGEFDECAAFYKSFVERYGRELE